MLNILLSRPVRAFLLATALSATVFTGHCSAQPKDPASAMQRLTPRQRSVLKGIADYAPFTSPERYALELGPVPTRTPVLLGAMRHERSWIRFLAYASRLEWTPAQAAANCKGLLGTLPASGKVRQNAIFLCALTAPDPTPRLLDLLTRPDLSEADRSDVLCALAALGDEAALTWFANELEPSECMRGQPLFTFHDYQRLEAQEEGRARTRTYRTWEVLMGRPYFRRLNLLQPSAYGLRRGARSESERRTLLRRLLPLFLRAWPGHPGSDDFAATLCHEALAAGDRLDAYRWAQRSTLLPDRDRGLTRTFTALADSQLTLKEVEALLDSDDGAHNRDFLRYTCFLKRVRADLDAGLRDFDECAEDSAGVFARARRAAADVDVPAGLRGGLDQALTLELLVAFPVRSQALAKTPTTGPEDDGQRYLNVLSTSEREVARRTRLDGEDSIALDVSRLARQYRLLVELRQLRRLEVAATGTRKAELRTLRARMLYRNPDAFFPVWGSHHMNFGYDLNAVRCDAKADARLSTYVAQTFHLRRAYALFESVLVDFPSYPGKDRVLNALAQCSAKLMDYRPAKAVDVWIYPDPLPRGRNPQAFAHGRVADWFERVARECPASPLADAAERAARYRRAQQRRARLRAKAR